MLIETCPICNSTNQVDATVVMKLHEVSDAVYTATMHYTQCLSCDFTSQDSDQAELADMEYANLREVVFE